MTTKGRHKPTFSVKNYPCSAHAQRISWTCSCGKSGAVVDGASGVTMKRARYAHTKHAAASADQERG